MKTQNSSQNIAQKIYNLFVRPYLPYKISVHNGVPVKNSSKLFDLTDVFPEYEDALISAIRNQTTDQDTVTVVGGGLGVSTVVAALKAGHQGFVKTYEASAEQFKIVNNTIRLNKISDRVGIKHAIVGKVSEYSSDVYGDPRNADVVKPSALPESDVLILDCEGAENKILENMSISPRVIIVETHAFLNSGEEQVKDTLKECNYEIINRGVEMESKGIFVLTAQQRN